MAWNLSDSSFGKDQSLMLIEPANILLNKHKVPKGSDFKDNTYILDILSKLKQFKDESRFCDVEIIVGKETFQAHKAVLAAWSPYFSGILNPQIKEVKDCVLVEHIDTDVFATFLDFLYAGNIEPNESNVMELLGLSRDLQVESLTLVCEEFLNLTVDVSNFVSRLLTSHKYNLQRLAEKVMNFGQQNLSTVVQQREFLSIPPAKFYQLLNLLKLGQRDMEVKLGLISHWVGFRIEEREKFVLHLLTNVNWRVTPSEVIRYMTSSDSLFTGNEFCLFQLMHKLFMSFQQLGPYMNTYQSLHQIFKDVIDLDFPRELSSSDMPEESKPLPVNVVLKAQCKDSISEMPVTKDASINTDIDSTYFNELSVFEPSASTPRENVSARIKEEVTSGGDLENEVDVELNCETITQNYVEEIKPTEHVDDTCKKSSRRKGRPRKHQKTDDASGVLANTKSSSKKTKTDKKNKVKSKHSSNEKGKLKIKIKPLEKKPVVPDGNKEEDRIVKVENEDTGKDNNNSDTDHYMSDLEQINIEEEKKAVEAVKSQLANKKARLKASRCSVYKSKKIKANIQSKKQEARLRDRSRPVIKCSEENCDFQTRSDKFLSRHVELVHNMNVKLSCRHCEYTTSLMRDLCLHSKQHYPNGPPYRCGEPDCDYQGLRMGLLIRHLMEHKNEKPYTCDVCSKSFRTENQLSCHKKLHEGNYKMSFYYIQLTLVISNSLISNSRLSRSENLVSVLTQRSTNRQQNIVEKRRNCSLGAISPLFHIIFNISLT